MISRTELDSCVRLLLVVLLTQSTSTLGLLINAVGFVPPVPPALSGNLSSNQALTQAERIHTGLIGVPHSYVTLGDDVFAVTSTGLVVNVAACQPVVVASLRPRGCWTLRDCGHLISIRVTSELMLLVLDAYHGLYQVNPITGVSRKLFNSRTVINGRPANFLTDFVVMADDTIILSDSSPTFDYDSEFWIRFQGNPDGRLIGFSPLTGQSKEILSGLAYPTGLEITQDAQALLVSEASRARILRVELSPDKFFHKTFLVANLPGMPEHIRKSGRGNYWVGLTYPRHGGLASLLDQYGDQPAYRNFLATRKSMADLRPTFNNWGLAVELDSSGQILRSVHDPSGMKVKEVLEVTEFSGVLYVGTRLQPATVRVVGAPNQLSVDSLVQVLRGRCSVSEDKVQATKESIQKRISHNKTEQSPSEKSVHQTSLSSSSSAVSRDQLKSVEPRPRVSLKTLSRGLFKLQRSLLAPNPTHSTHQSTSPHLTLTTPAGQVIATQSTPDPAQPTLDAVQSTGNPLLPTSKTLHPRQDSGTGWSEPTSPSPLDSTAPVSPGIKISLMLHNAEAEVTTQAINKDTSAPGGAIMARGVQEKHYMGNIVFRNHLDKLLSTSQPFGSQQNDASVLNNQRPSLPAQGNYLLPKETAQSGSGTAQSGSETAQSGSGTAQGGSETAQSGLETAQSGSETAQSGPKTTQTGSEPAQTGSETAQTGSETAFSGFTNRDTAQKGRGLSWPRPNLAATQSLETSSPGSLTQDLDQLGGFMGFLATSSPPPTVQTLSSGRQTYSHMFNQDPMFADTLPDPGLQGSSQLQPVPTQQFLPGMDNFVSLEQLKLNSTQQQSGQSVKLSNHTPPAETSEQSLLYKRPVLDFQDVSMKEASEIQHMQMFHPTEPPERWTSLPQQIETTSSPILFAETAGFPGQTLESQQVYSLSQDMQPSNIDSVKPHQSNVGDVYRADDRRNQNTRTQRVQERTTTGRTMQERTTTEQTQLRVSQAPAGDQPYSSHVSSNTQFDSFDPGALLHQGSAIGNLYDHSAQAAPTSHTNLTSAGRQFLISKAATVVLEQGPGHARLDKPGQNRLGSKR